MNYLNKLAVKMNSDDFVKFTNKRCVQDKEYAWQLFREGLSGNVTKKFLKKCNLTKDTFCPGNDIWHAGIYSQIDKYGLDEHTTTVRDLLRVMTKK